MDIKKRIKNFIIGMSLGKRLTLYFVLFGLLIGYLTFILIMAVTTHHYIRIASEEFVSIVRDLAGTEYDDFAPVIVGRKNPRLAESIRLVDRLLSRGGARMNFGYYAFNSSSKTWERLYLGRDDVFRAAPVDGNLARRLELVECHRLAKASGLYYGRSDRVSMLMRLGPPDSSYRHVLAVDADRDGIDVFMRRNRDMMALFMAGLLAVSVLLGKFFALRISRPIKKLAGEATRAAAGGLDPVFNVKRRDEIGLLSDSLNVMTGRIRSHVGEIERRIRAMETMNRIDKEVLSSTSRNDLLDRVMGIVSSLFNTSSIAMVLRDGEKKGFEVLSFYQGGGRGMLKDEPFVHDGEIPGDYLSYAETLSLLSVSGGERTPRFVRDILELRTGSLVNAPIHIAGRYLGSLLVGKGGPAGLTEEELGTIGMLADQIGVALQSVRSFEEKEKILLGIMLALTRSIDAKSKWTAGHSERVAGLAEALALRLDYGEERLRTLALSAILHDIGKIAVPELILDKPARLTAEEYEIIKRHPSVGAEIISDIPSYANIVPGILYHHEHWDGSGYPLGLRGDEIPLNGRLITIADVYDAVTADRPYRSGMTPDDAVAFLRNNGGTLFDPALVNVFIDLVKDPGAVAPGRR